MPKFSEVIYTVKNLPRGGNGDSRSNPYTDRQLAFIINYHRAVLIKQYKDKSKYISQNHTQTLGSVEVIQASKNECCDIDCDLGDIVYRTKNPIPRVIDTNGWNLITYVGTIDGLTNWQRTTYNKLSLDKYSKYTGKRPKWYELNNYLYIANPPSKLLKYINIQGVFEDPLAANNFKECGCDGEDCFKGYEFDYPMNSSDIPIIIKLIASSELAMSGMLPKDEKNDSRDAASTN